MGVGSSKTLWYHLASGDPQASIDMTGKDDRDKPPFDDGDDWIDRDDAAASSPLIDRDEDEIFGADPPPREAAFPEEREYPTVPDWDDDGSDPGSMPVWDEPSADNDDLNRLAARELDELGDNPYPAPPDESLPPMSTGPGAGAAASTESRYFMDSDSEDSFEDVDDRPADDPHSGAPPRDDPLPPGPLPYDANPADPRSGDSQESWRDDSSVDSGDDSWSDESAPAAAVAGAGDRAFTAGDAAVRELSPDAHSGDSSSKRWPIAMLAIAALAVVLLAVGGYGVLSERSALEDEIRQLQAQLATAVSPEEARASRDAQAAIEREKIAVEAELNVLQSENAELQAAMRDLESSLAEQQREVEIAVAAAQEAAAARSSAAATSSAATGDWFVNFGSYARVNDARRWSSRLEVDSGNVVVQDARSQGRTIYRVRVVGLADKSAADRVARQLEADHKLPKLWVGKN